MSNSFFAAYLLVLVFSIIGCIEREDGCLDVTATNFAAAADNPCPDSCCVYPDLNVTVRHRFRPADRPDTLLAFSYDSTYSVLPQPLDSFTFDSIRFFLSNFELIDASGTASTVEDELEVRSASGTSITIADNFLSAAPRIFNASRVGTLRAPGTYFGVRFLLGLETETRTAELSDFPDGHPLDLPENAYSYRAGDGFIPLRVRLVAPPAASDTLDVTVLEPIAVELEFDEPFVLEPGFDLDLTLAVDYAIWLEGGNVTTATEADIRNQIQTQAANSFLILAVE